LEKFVRFHTKEFGAIGKEVHKQNWTIWKILCKRISERF